MIETFALSKIYPSSGKGVKNINLRISKGEIFGLLGPNGSGKSTLIKVLSTLLQPTQGYFKIQGYSSRDYVEEIRRKIGVVFDQTSHFEKLTGFENVYFFSKIYNVKKPEIFRLLKEFNLYQYKDQLVKTYSRGMKQKLSLVEAFVHEPEVLLLDEPTQNLDYISKLKFYSKLKTFAKEGKTILIATNDVFEAEKICTKVAFIYNGEIIDIDTPKNFLKSIAKVQEISITLSKPINPKILEKISGIEKIVARENKIKILAKKVILPEVVSKIVSVKGRIKDIKVKEPNLGDVFIKKVGVDIT
jgi:ABC-2 type transport system ATP-binding protein